MNTPHHFTVRLGKHDRAALREHFLALGPEDRRLRFGGPLANEAIDRYVDRIDFVHDCLFAVHADDLRLLAVVHVALGDGPAELGLSVLSGRRGHGMGNALLRRAVTWLRNRGVASVQVHCLAENGAMMHVARKNGMRIAHSGPESDARLELDSPTPDSFMAEWIEDQRGQAINALRTGGRWMQAFIAGAARPS